MKKFIFLASTTYTGSTMVSTLLGDHPEITTISELTGVIPEIDAANYTCSCGDKLRECKFYKDVSSEYFRLSGKHLDLNNFGTRFYKYDSRFLRNLIFRSLYSNSLETIRESLVARKFKADIQAWLENTRCLVDSICKVSDKTVFLDASKDPSRIPYLYKIYGSDLSVVQLVRDVRGFSNSSLKHGKRSVASSALAWTFLHSDVERICQRFKIPRIVIKYEDIVDDDLSAVNSIAEFVGLRDVTRVSYKPEDMHIIGNATRLKRDLYLKKDESWINELSSRQQRLAVSIGERVMSKLGYLL